MSLTTCLVCKEAISDPASGVQVQQFVNCEAIHSVHFGCFFCVKCSAPLGLNDAFVDDDTKLLYCIDDLVKP